MSNPEKYPEAWQYFKRNARNIENVPQLNVEGNYCIVAPNGSVVYANDPGDLFDKFKYEFYISEQVRLRDRINK